MLPSARVVLNHSTHVPGLIAFLHTLDASLATTIVPGRITRGQGNAQHLAIRVTVPIPGGFKALAKRGSLVQEVFFTSAVAQDELQQMLDKRLGELR